MPSSYLQEMRQDHLGRLRPACQSGAGRRPGLPALRRPRQRPCRQRRRLAAQALQPRLSRHQHPIRTARHFSPGGNTVIATPTARIIDVATLRSRLDEDAPRILDVRTPAEFETAHIPGSYNVPLDLLREHRDELARHIDEDVVLVCRSGARASQAEQALGQAGLPGLHVLDGGMDRWERSGAPVTRGRRTWDLERQVRLVAGSVVATSVAGSSAPAPTEVDCRCHRRRPRHRRDLRHLRPRHGSGQDALEPPRHLRRRRCRPTCL